nr:MAG TPA: hypothetical protein [Bacteriophage sp.]
MSKNMQAESNVCQACLNGIAEAQPLFCKEHFISCFAFCSFALSYNPDKVGAFVEVERIDHVGAAVRPTDGVVEGDAQNACRLVHLEIHTVQVHTRLEHHHRPLYLVAQQGLRGDVHNLEHVPPHGAAVVVAVDALAGRGAQQRPQTLAYVLLVGGHPRGCAVLIQCRRKTPAVAEECPVFVHLSFYIVLLLHLFSNPVFDRPEKGNRLPLASVR